jgi:hypothetical protein
MMKWMMVFLLLTGRAWSAELAPSKPFDQETFRSAKFGNIVCFDLRDDSQYKAGVFLKYQGDDKSTQSHYLALPFAAKSVDAIRDPVTTWGSYGQSTMIAYLVRPGQNPSFSLGIDPILHVVPDSDRCDEAASDVVCVAGTNSLIREFSYPYHSKGMDWSKDLGVKFAQLEAIAVALPKGSRGIDIRLNRSAIPGPMPDTGNEVVSYYPASDATEHVLRLRYEVPPSEGQKEVLDLGVKLLGGGFTPLVELLMLSQLDPKKKIWQRRILIVGFVFQICVVLVVGFVAYKIHNELSIKAINDVAVALVGCLLSGLLLWFKGDTKAAATS